ncbi:hypothetical protein CDL12_11096 [Handroanthus impetiginosus]|uniref:Uncharacterized protein n=1 Tax=Handroanthus impetiginosus TaxID=429701 RepID=A0A2G9HFP0_9LAMI|nr:hypothetical protein CDL12_11096 [Handroanthus impetiginosus]
MKNEKRRKGRPTKMARRCSCNVTEEMVVTGDYTRRCQYHYELYDYTRRRCIPRRFEENRRNSLLLFASLT